MVVLRVLVSLVAWAAFAVYTAFWSTIVILLSFLLWPVDPTARAAQLAVTIWGPSCILLHPRWRVTVRGRELLRGGPFVVCPTHQSYADAFALSALHAHWKVVGKRSLFFVPFFGWAMGAIGNVGVVRGDRRSGEAMFAGCRRWLDRGVSILIFPEGTRSTDGELQAFKHGAFTLAAATGTSVLPIVVDGTWKALRKGGLDWTGPADMRVSVLTPIAPARFGGDAEALKVATREAIAAELARLRAEARA